MSDRVGEISTGKALAMAYVFANVYSRMFKLVITNRSGPGIQSPCSSFKTTDSSHPPSRSTTEGAM